MNPSFKTNYDNTSFFLKEIITINQIKEHFGLKQKAKILKAFADAGIEVFEAFGQQSITQKDFVKYILHQNPSIQINTTDPLENIECQKKKTSLKS